MIDDLSRPVATRTDSEYTLTIDEAASLEDFLERYLIRMGETENLRALEKKEHTPAGV
jgi:hypothetical protein